MTLETALREHEEAWRECNDCARSEHEAAKARLYQVTDQIAEMDAISPAELIAKFDVLRDAIPFRGMGWDHLRPYRLLHSIRNDVERLLDADRIALESSAAPD